MDDLGLELRDGYRWLRVFVQRQPLLNTELDWDRDMLDAIVDADTAVFRGRFKTKPWAHGLADLRSLLLISCRLLNALHQERPC